MVEPNGAVEEPNGISEVDDGAQGTEIDDSGLTVEALQKQLSECQTQSENYLDQWRRTAAEFANYKKRCEREQAEATRYCNGALITRLLPMVDDLDRAFDNLPEDLVGQPWIEGMSLVLHKMHAIFEKEGVREIDAEGQAFDPVLHEAVTHEPSDSVPEGNIVGVVQKGYMLNDRVLRPAMVRVSAGGA